MTDISKYRSLAVSHNFNYTYDKKTWQNSQESMAPGVTLSRAQTIKVIVDEKVKKLNGKYAKSISKSD